MVVFLLSTCAQSSEFPVQKSMKGSLVLFVVWTTATQRMTEKKVWRKVTAPADQNGILEKSSGF